MKEIPIDNISLYEGLHAEVVTIHGTFKGVFSSDRAAMPQSPNGAGICSHFNIHDLGRNEVCNIDTLHLLHFFVKDDEM